MKQTIGKGFTLIELLIVVAIIAILAAIAVPNFLEAQTRAKVSRALADMRTLATGIESYRVDNPKYPPFGAPSFASTACGSAVIGSVGHALIADSVTGATAVGGGPECGVSSRLMWITTPIAYLTSVFPEAFSVNSTTLVGLAGENPKNYDTYDFFVADNATLEGTLGIIRGLAENRGFGTTSGAQWRLSSAGPDNIQAFGGRFISDGVGFEANQLGADYDSSNGTVSAGDIVRVGGGRGTEVPGGERPYFYRVGNNLRSVNNVPPF